MITREGNLGFFFGPSLLAAIVETFSKKEERKEGRKEGRKEEIEIEIEIERRCQKKLYYYDEESLSLLRARRRRSLGLGNVDTCVSCSGGTCLRS